ncbi:hypothetical protein RJT34_08580 [Clitoria ternatea]|uniref:Receptor-like serine/threonine-protein kinase n=1 Tax=Clitoria ternatea TaxID=43366 RepID=A0AAN9K4S4_CLITE
MYNIFFLLVILFVSTSSAATDTLQQTFSLSVENPNDTLVSSNRDFSAGFFQVGDNAFCFSVWFTRSKQPTVIWIANRDAPVNGKSSKLSLLRNGNLVLIDAARTLIWATATLSSSQLHLKLTNNGNLVLAAATSQPTVVWQSFNSPTDTLLPGQPVTEQASLVSSRSTTNFSSGFYKFYFDNDNVLRLLYKGPNLSSVYWPAPWKLAIDQGRSTYNVTKIAVLDSFGSFTSSDGFHFLSVDYPRKIYRRLKIDPDGNLRVYSFNEEEKNWEVSWQVIPEPCAVHGICGANSMCTVDPFLGRTCFCLQGFKVKNPNDWSQGCEPEFNSDFSCNRKESMGFLHLPTTELFGYDLNVTRVSSLEECQNLCLDLCDGCRGVQFKFNEVSTYNCYPKTMLLNGRDTPNFDGEVYLKLPKAILNSKKPIKHSTMKCSIGLSQRLNRIYHMPARNSTLSFLVWFTCGIGVFEVSIIFLVWFFLFRTNKQPGTIGHQQRHLLSATGFQRYTYAELKTATKGFKEKIGRGAGGVVYKGTLTDERVAAIKRLNEANQGEADFLAEISTIGMLNHMNLIDMWGYCVEGKHRLLVYEYMENGSLANNLVANNRLDWNKRFNVALGTAKGLAYLHEECLEWILHCDVKPQNILLDSDFSPKVADFGLSKLLNRDEERGSSGFSRIRGTRGYMAPEWVYNFRITSKVDVYSYGVVVLEMVSGRSPMEIQSLENSSGIEQRRLVTWITDKIKSAPSSGFWIEEIVDNNLEGRYDVSQVEVLVKVALQCVQDDMNQRPSMSHVVEMLQSHQNKTTPR